MAFRYVPRELNAVPDDMCRRAREAGQTVEFEDGVVPQDAPEVNLADLYKVVDELASGRQCSRKVAAPARQKKAPTKDLEDSEAEAVIDAVLAVWEERIRGVPCVICNGVEDEAEMVVCDRCNKPHHPNCITGEPPGRGPWYCSLCRGTIVLQGSTDPVEDLVLLDYLFRQQLPEEQEDIERV